MNEWFQSLRSEFADKDYAHDYADELLYAYIATQIKVLRQQQGLTQQKLAQLADMKQERISVLEDVNYSSWTITTLLKLARAFDLRLRVSFENFSTVLNDMFRLSPESLQRTKREEDLGLAPIAQREVADALLQILESGGSEQEPKPTGTDERPRPTPLITTLSESMNPLVRPNRQLAQGPQSYQQ